MYLSRAYLNPLDSQVRQDLTDVYDLHRTLSVAFPETKNDKSYRSENNLLFRLEAISNKNKWILLIQSKIIPNWNAILKKHPEYFLGQPESKDLTILTKKLKENQKCRFRLKANPTKRPPPKKYAPNSIRGKTNRIPIVKDEDLTKWIRNKGLSCGFELCNVHNSIEKSIYDIRISKKPNINKNVPFKYTFLKGKKKSHNLKFNSVIFDGHLIITQIEKFKDTLIKGIGSGKAFGFGLLSIHII